MTVPESRTVSVFLIPSDDDYRYTEGLIRHVSDRLAAPRFMPHLTLCSGTTENHELLIETVEKIARSSSPFTLPVAGVGCSDDYFRTLFMEFRETPFLTGMHNRLGEQIRRRAGSAFRPHLSLLYREMPLEEKEALARTIRLDRDRIHFDGIAIVTPGNDDDGWRDTHRWQVLFRGKLSGAQPLRVILFDYGGVLAEEGFREGLRTLAVRQGLDPDTVHRAGMEEVYATGYVLGQGSEGAFWQAMRTRTGLVGDDRELTRVILDRFILRPGMLDAVRDLRARGFRVAILSDQTDWLERLDRRDRFYGEFERVFNSYRIGKGKTDPSLFDDVMGALGVAPGEALFVDDMPGNVERAASRGLNTILFRDAESFRKELARLTGER